MKDIIIRNYRVLRRAFDSLINDIGGKGSEASACKAESRKKYAGAGIAAAMLLSIWGILYPELYLHPDIIRTISEEGREEEVSPDAYTRFLDADSGQITIKWKFAEFIEHCLQDGRDNEKGA